MRTKQSVELLVTWLVRILLLPLALVFGWYALRGFVLALGGAAADDILSPTIAGSGFFLLMAGWLTHAIIYPSAPWHNEPLKKFCACALILIGVVALWIGTCLAAGEIVVSLFGRNHPYNGLLVFGSSITVAGIEYLTYHMAKRGLNWLRRWIKERAAPENRPPAGNIERPEFKGR